MKPRTRIRDHLLFTEAWTLLAVARLMLVFCPFKKLVPLMQAGKETTTQSNLERLTDIQVAIARACTKSPWRTKCFEQALAGSIMLRRRHINATIYFGLKKDAPGDALQAHAWLKSGDMIVTGWQRVNSYTVVAIF